MGQLSYQRITLFDIEDRALAHLRIVVMTKLRRREPFMLQLPHPEIGYMSVWVSPSIALDFRFFGSRPPAIDHALIDAWFEQASSPDGLTLGR